MAELRDGLQRRDEQIEFLMQVHDASQECEWVPVPSASARGSAPRPSPQAAANTGRGAGGSPFAAARHINSAAGSAAGSAANGGGSAAAGGSASSEFAMAIAAMGPWQCKACTLRNEASRTLCEACNTDRFS